jgi:hypothetical protein
MLHGAQLDWSAWHVEVYDANGRVVLTKAFTDVRYDPRPPEPGETRPSR